MDKILRKKSFPDWVKKLQSYDIYAPVCHDDIWDYERVDNPDQISFDFPFTVQSPKKIIYPQREVFLEFSNSPQNGVEVEEVVPEEKKAVVFGVRPCDAKALILHDKVFGGDFKDIYYWKRRNPTNVVGMTCATPPSLNCFCTSVDGNPSTTDGMDILLTDLGDRYYVEAFTKDGQALLGAGKQIFQTPKPQDKKDAYRVKIEAAKQVKRQIKKLETIPPKLKGMFDSPLWDEESMSCLRCGICTYLCPTCHCFDIQDEITSRSPLQGKRVRTWDTCQFPDFTMHSSGHNPRPDKASRLRQRVLHKFQYFVEVWGDYQCTGCGRCISKCPVGIDILEVLDKVRDHDR